LPPCIRERHPQIAAFARVANGSPKPNRQMYGATTILSRIPHDIRYDEIHDEIVITTHADAILTFRGTRWNGSTDSRDCWSEDKIERGKFGSHGGGPGEQRHCGRPISTDCGKQRQD